MLDGGGDGGVFVVDQRIDAADRIFGERALLGVPAIGIAVLGWVEQAGLEVGEGF